MEPQVVADTLCHTGENPLWHPDEKRLYWTDIPRGRLFRYDPATGAHELCTEGEPVGGFTLQEDGALLLFMARGAVMTWRDAPRTVVFDELPEERDTRFNDVIADPEGRVFCGVMSTPRRLGRLYRLDPDRTLTVVADGVGTSNGMGFTLDRKRMYHTDSRARTIAQYDYDRRTGALTSRRDYVRVPEGQGVPDGLTVDAEGHVWSARWDGGCLVRYTPEGQEEQRIAFPARKVSSLAFGGEDTTDLYVTTAGGHNRAEEGPSAGALFRLRPGVRGLPEFRSRIQ